MDFDNPVLDEIEEIMRKGRMTFPDAVQHLAELRKLRQPAEIVNLAEYRRAVAEASSSDRRPFDE